MQESQQYEEIVNEHASPLSEQAQQPAPAARHWSQGRLGAASHKDSSEDDAHSIQFLGSGSEYFRIWIVNLCLSIATLGIYSAWAKVRRLQYFERNTQLAGAVFNFHGNPKAILRGRIIALALLIAYHYAFGFSKAIGVGVVAFLFVSMPWFLRSALRFRTRNTSYRGLRFDFNGSLAGAYATYLPMMLVFLLPGTLLALYPTNTLAYSSFMLYLLWPLLHARIKRYQHENIKYGSTLATYDLPSSRFWRPYIIAILLGLMSLVLVTCIVALTFGIANRTSSAATNSASSFTTMVIIFASTLATTYLLYLFSGPYLHVRLQNLVWSHTSFQGMRIESRLRAGPYLKLQAVNVLFTLLSLGLYRPFALVKVHRYRLGQVSVTAAGGFANVLAAEHRESSGASGEGTADFLGIDLSW